MKFEVGCDIKVELPKLRMRDIPKVGLFRCKMNGDIVARFGDRLCVVNRLGDLSVGRNWSWYDIACDYEVEPLKPGEWVRLIQS